MKRRSFIFASLLCMYGATAHASNCFDAGCDNIPTTNVKMLSVKAVPIDERGPLWSGEHGYFAPRAYDKTVSTDDGAPLWDDSIVSYMDKDFSDWFLTDTPAVWAPGTKRPAPAPAMDGMTQDIDLDAIQKMYEQNMADAAATRARVEELLTPKKPSGNLWTDDVAVETTVITPNAPDTVADVAPVAEKIETTTVTETIVLGDGCPFETDAECEIWRRKPMMRETVSPRSPKIRDDKMALFISAARMNKNIPANADVAAPLLARYKMLMRAAKSCCTDGMVHTLRDAGASDGLIYKFLADDANFYGIGSRCLMTTDAQLDETYPNTATAAAVADVRNGCLCRGREWFTSMLAPFVDAYAAAPEFKDAKFNYTYTDGLGRQMQVSVNSDVKNVLDQLSVCP